MLAPCIWRRLQDGSAFHKAFSLAIVAVCTLGFGCGRDAIWKETLQSPDGQWLASAETIQNGGFGSASIETSIYLKKDNVLNPLKEVLAFQCEGPAPRPYVVDNVANKGGTINLTMKWLTPSHLEVTYNGRASINFQVVKYEGIDISVRELSNDAANPSR